VTSFHSPAHPPKITAKITML